MSDCGVSAMEEYMSQPEPDELADYLKQENKMKGRYILFSGAVYYARGGAHDIVDSGQDIEELIKSRIKDPDYEYQWWHIFDTETNKIVIGSEDQALGAGNLDDEQIHTQKEDQEGQQPSEK